MSGFIDKAKDLAEDAKDKAGDIVEMIDEKIPDSVKDKVGSLTEKVKDLLPSKDPGDEAREKLGDSVDTEAVIKAEVEAELGDDAK